jgi:hypothetical protein
MRPRLLAVLSLCGVVPAVGAACAVDPLTPARLRAAAAVQPLCAGFVDATLPPYSAAGDGVADDSAALQDAADDAYAASMTLLLPAGRVFLMTRQLLLLQRFCYPPCGNTRRHGMQVVGGGGGARPLLRLQDNATVAGGVFVKFDAVDADNVTTGDTASQYQARWRGVDIDMGANAAVSALSMSAAQLCSIEDTAITGRAFFAGVNGLPGSGGFSANVNVTGGAYGIVQDEYRPNPSIAGLRLVGQARAGVLVRQARGPVVVTGFLIESPAAPDARWRAVLLNSSVGPAPAKDNAFAGEDGVFVLHGGGAGGVFVESGGCDVALRNVFFAPGRGDSALFAAPRFGAAVPRGGPPADAAWVRLARLAFSASGGTVWDAGVNASAGRAVTAYVAPPGPTRAGAPPAALAESHTWAPGGPPSWAARRGAGLLDATAFGATPAWVNATDDDGAAIQAALDASCVAGSPAFGLPVFLPHGEFGLYRPLQLRGCASLIGAGSHSSWLATLPARPVDAAACWDGASAPLGAMLVSALPAAAAAAPPTTLSDFGLVARPLCPFLDLRAGADTLLRDVCVAASVPPPSGVPPSSGGPPPTEPFVALSGSASGRFFGLSLDLIFGGNDGASPPPGPRHVLLIVNGTGGGGGGGDVHFYQLSTEHKPVAKAVLFAGARGVHVHAWKSESVLFEPHTGGAGDTQSLVWIVDCANVTLFGHSGNFRQFNTSVGVVDVSGRSAGIEAAAMTRTYWPTEPAEGTMWVRDAAAGVALDGHHQVGLYRRP